MGNDLKSKTLSGIAWKYAERWGVRGIRFIISIVLARLMIPEAYGLVGLISAFIAISDVFIDSGLGQALVQRKNADDVDFSTVFFYNLGFSVVLYGVLCVCAPWIAGFYDEPQLTPVVRVLSFSLVIDAVQSTQGAYVQKTMQFKLFFWATIWGTVASGIVGIWMAYCGLGVWALVGQDLTNKTIDTLVLWCTVKWRPKLKFSIRRMKELFSFGWKLLCSSLLDTAYGNIYSLLIGKFYSPAELAYYDRGKHFPSVVLDNISGSIAGALFPAMAFVQDDRERLKRMTRRSIVTMSFFIFPCMAGLAAVAEPLVRLLLTDKWLPAVPFVCFCCFTSAFTPMSVANLQAINAIGRSDVFLKLEILKKIVGVAALVITLPHGLYAMMVGSCISGMISVFLNAFPNRKLLGYGYLKQLKDLAPSLLLSVFMGGAVWLLNLLSLPTVPTLAIQVAVGVGIYFGGAKLLKMECLEYVWNTVKDIKRSRGRG